MTKCAVKILTHNFEEIKLFSHQIVNLASEFFLHFVPLGLTDHLLVVQLLLVAALVFVLPGV